jgi:hypothetical protein
MTHEALALSHTDSEPLTESRSHESDSGCTGRLVTLRADEPQNRGTVPWS